MCKLFSVAGKLNRSERSFVFCSFSSVLCRKRFFKTVPMQLLVWSTGQFVSCWETLSCSKLLWMTDCCFAWLVKTTLTTGCSWKWKGLVLKRSVHVCFLTSIRLNEKNRFNVEQKKSENFKNNIEKFFLFFKTYASKTLGNLSSNFGVDENRLFFRNWNLKLSSDHRRLETSWHSSHF